MAWGMLFMHSWYAIITLDLSYKICYTWQVVGVGAGYKGNRCDNLAIDFVYHILYNRGNV